MAYISDYPKVTNIDKVIIDKQTSETLAQWVLTLNHWEWPDELPKPEKPYCFFKKIFGIKYSTGVSNTRRHHLIKFISETVGWRYILRRSDVWEGRTDEEFEDFCTMPSREYWNKWRTEAA